MKKAVFKTSMGWIGLAATARGVSALVLPKPSRRAAERALRALNGNVGAGLIPARLKREGYYSARPLAGLPSPTQQTQASAIYLKEARSAITAYLAGKARSFALPLDWGDPSPFQMKVWAVLRSIPYGRVRSYGWVARKI